MNIGGSKEDTDELIKAPGYNMIRQKRISVSTRTTSCEAINMNIDTLFQNFYILTFSFTGSKCDGFCIL